MARGRRRRRKEETEKEEQLDANEWEKDEQPRIEPVHNAVAREKEGDVLEEKIKEERPESLRENRVAR